MLSETKQDVKRFRTYEDIKAFYEENKDKLSGAAKSYTLYKLRSLSTQEKFNALMAKDNPKESLVDVFDGGLF